ncbi:hypothetical protein [Mesorhizobium sp. SP-1A]|uniref:hypothetical protein n=1 Tax=Mesorhizobium sp. SP-1A TaxID=3077840 RepID=UPI0028F6F3D2|nr:hypothetical protein [Mesorhizobium sp. SP-1A]
MTDLPILSFDHLFHIGTLNADDRSRNYRDSYEGNCLSVSVTPHAWQQIAKLGGYDLHELTKEGGQLVDVHATRNSDDFAEIVAWGKANGLVEDRQVFKGWECNEDDEWAYTYFESEEAALEELDMDGEYEGDIDLLPHPEDHKAIEPVTILGGTAALSQIVGRDFDVAEAVDDYLIMAYARQVMDVDGIWWNEAYDPDSYSAPRGGIFPNKVAEWTAVEIDFDAVDDDDELCELNEIMADSISGPKL